MIDLHTHSTASDGTDDPAELVARAHAAGVRVLGLTDHDTTSGWAAATQALPSGMVLIPGTEFSCVHHTSEGRRISLHLLGYLFDPGYEPLQAERMRLRSGRRERGRRIVDNMVADGVPISWGQVEMIAGGAAVGRPHIGRALVESGVVPDVSAAFADLLSSRRRYYVAKPDTEVLTAVRLVRAAGGLPVFAHPRARRRGPVVPDEVVAAMAEAGLVGIEVDHPDHDAEDRAHAAGLAKDLGLVRTGSSDYHGTNKTVPLGACTTSPEDLAALLALPAARRPLTAA